MKEQEVVIINCSRTNNIPLTLRFVDVEYKSIAFIAIAKCQFSYSVLFVLYPAADKL